MHRIVVTTGDIGDANSLVPVLKRLQGAGVEISAFADPKGKGKDEFKKAGIAYTEASEVPAETMAGAALLLSGTAAKAPDLIVRATQQAQAAGKRAIWLEDFYLTASQGRMLECNPDCVIAADESARQITLRVRGTSFADRIRVLGSPTLDALVAMRADREAMRARLRDRLKLGERKLVVFSASASSQVNMAETLDPLCAAMRECGHPERVLLAVRFHPADKDQARWMQYAKELLPSVIAEEIVDLTEKDAILGCDVFTTQYSTGGIKASLMDIPTLFILLASAQKYQEQVRGAVKPYLPQIEVGAAAAAWEASVISTLLNRLLTDAALTGSLAEARKRNFVIDGKATERVADFVLSLIGDPAA